MNFETDHANTSIDDDIDPATDNEDIYAFFNLSKNATKEDINQAYRRLSVIYHPDKHSNPTLKLKAEKIFNKINRYYKILSDDQKRQLYDLNIVSSVDDLNRLEVIPFLDPITGQPVAKNQIKAEYERLVEQAQHERMMARSNPQGTIDLTLDCCDLFRPYRRILTYYSDTNMFAQSEPNRYPEFKRLNIGQSVECPCGANDRLILSGNLRSENGLGTGVMSVLWRHIIGRSVWSETLFAFGDQPSIDFDIYGPLVNKLHGIGSFRLNFANASLFPALNASFGE
uniref:J domain-containing protein n=1 Tax=Romanomermis culicivorax TaxID=13658 RepID=A0A915K0T6_ROMCU